MQQSPCDSVIEVVSPTIGSNINFVKRQTRLRQEVLMQCNICQSKCAGRLYTDYAQRHANSCEVLIRFGEIQSLDICAVGKHINIIH